MFRSHNCREWIHLHDRSFLSTEAIHPVKYDEHDVWPSIASMPSDPLRSHNHTYDFLPSKKDMHNTQNSSFNLTFPIPVSRKYIKKLYFLHPAENSVCITGKSPGLTSSYSSPSHIITVQWLLNFVRITVAGAAEDVRFHSLFGIFIHLLYFIFIYSPLL